MDDTQALALSHQICARADIATVGYVSKEEGLHYVERSRGYKQIFSSLPENSLPIVLKVPLQSTVNLQFLEGVANVW